MIFDLHELFEDAAERAGSELRTGFDYKSMRRSLGYLLREWMNQGYNLFSVAEGQITLTPGQAGYTLPTEIIDVMDAVIRRYDGTTQQVDISMRRVSALDYYQQPLKVNPGFPNQFYVKRDVTPEIVLWPVPSQPIKLVYWYMKQIGDSVSGDTQPAVPDRFVPALIAGLAFHFASKRPALKANVPDLKMEYDRQLMLAKEEDRDKASFYIMPG